MKKDIWRTKVAHIKLKQATKARRRALMRMRSNLKDKYEQTEGVGYAPNMALHQPAHEEARCGGEVFLLDDRALPPANEIKFVFFDTETNGFGQMIQIAAKLEGKEDKSFSAYAYPMNGIAVQATLTNRLSLDSGELCYNGKAVECTSLIKCLHRFLEFLKSLGGAIVLVAHNAEFDMRHAIDAYADYYLLRDFSEVVVAATCTIPIMKFNPTVVRDMEEAVKNGLNLEGIVGNVQKGRPKQATKEAGKVTKRTVRKKEEPAKFIPVVGQETLATRYIPKYKAGDAHEALYDCIILEDLCTALDVSRETLAANIKPISVYVARRVELLNRKKCAPSLAAMITPKLISAQTVNKLADKGFTMEMLAEKLLLEGEKDFAKYLKDEIINRAVSVNSIIGVVKRM